MAGEWTEGPQTVTYTATPTIGDGSNDQGGVAPAEAYEPDAIDENGLYDRDDWLVVGTQGTPPGTGATNGIDRHDAGEPKFRIHVEASHVGRFDPLLMPGMNGMSHHHTFSGNKNTDENSTYESLRTNPASTASGGPLNATAYWEPTLFYTDPNDIDLPVKPNGIAFYYTSPTYADTEHLYRLLRGLTFIAGCNPADIDNQARLDEIPDGGPWDKTQRYDGWLGWTLYNRSTFEVIPLAMDTDAGSPGGAFAHQLVNEDGSDPWGGEGEDPDLVLIANIIGPNCWDGHNLTSPNGRDHFRYPIHNTDTGRSDYGPDGWFKVPHFEVKSEFPNGRGAISGHAYRSKCWLSSDRYDMEGNLWPEPRKPGRTFHADWMGAWDDFILQSSTGWLVKCAGVTIGATPGEPLTCGTSTINETQRMKGFAEASPDPTLSNDPILTAHDYVNAGAKESFFPLESGTTVSSCTVSHS